MLHAQLHGKLNRLATTHLNSLRAEAQAEADWDNAVRRDEDSLTATIFSRLAYLGDEVLASLMNSGILDALGPSSWPDWPTNLHEGPRYWPALKPAPEDPNRDKVEPDVVLVYETCVIVIEVKWQESEHGWEQWRTQIRAARQAFPKHEIRFLAVGPRHGTRLTHHALAEELFHRFSSQTIPRIPVAWLDWRVLYDALECMKRTDTHLPQATRLVVDDLCAALEHRGFCRARWLGQLSPTPPIAIDSHVLLARWSPMRMSV